MDETEVESVGEAELTDPVLIEGLPGVGHVGKLAAEHLLSEFEAETTEVRRLHSEHLPPQVSVAEDGLAELARLRFHAVSPPEAADLLVVTGDHQAQSNHGHYRLTAAVLDVAEEFGAGRAFAMGGVPTGELIEEYDVLGAATTEESVESLRAAGVEFREGEPAGGIVGVSGLLLGLGDRRGFEAACLMGETSGYLVDPKSARAVLETLDDLLELDLDYADLEDRAEEMEEVIKRIREMEDRGSMEMPEDDLRYFG